MKSQRERALFQNRIHSCHTEKFALLVANHMGYTRGPLALKKKWNFNFPFFSQHPLKQTSTPELSAPPEILSRWPIAINICYVCSTLCVGVWVGDGM